MHRVYLPTGYTSRCGSFKDAETSTKGTFSGYGLAEGESITFFTRKEMEDSTHSNGECDYILFVKREDDDKNETMLVLVKDSKGFQRWFNMNCLLSSMYDSKGNEVVLDEFRRIMSSFKNNRERLDFLYGATIIGIKKVNGYSKYGEREFIIYDYLLESDSVNVINNGVRQERFIKYSDLTALKYPYMVIGKYSMDTDEFGWCLYDSMKYYCDSFSSVKTSFQHYINEAHSINIEITEEDIKRGVYLPLGRHDDSPLIECKMIIR